MLVLNDAHAGEGCVHVRQEVLDSLLPNRVELLACLVGDAAVHRVPAKVFPDPSDCVQKDSFFSQFLGFSVRHLVHGGDGFFEHEPFTERLGHNLDLIRNFVHPNVEERLALLHHELLHEFAHRLDKGLLLVVDQICEGLKRSDRLKVRDLTDRALSQLGHAVDLLLNVSEEVLDDLLHQDTVVTLSCHGRVTTGDTFWDCGHSQVTTAAAPLTACVPDLLHMPAHHAFDGAEDTDELVLVTLRVYKDILGLVVTEIEHQGASEKRQNRVLLKLVGHNRGVRLARGTDRESLLAVPDSDEQHLLDSGEGHGRDTHSSAEQSVCHFEEPLAALGDIALEVSLIVNVRESVEHVDAGNLHVVKSKSGVVNTVQLELHAHVFDCDSSTGLHVFIANLHHERVNTLILTLDNGLGENDRVVCVARAICDPELLRE